MAEEELELELDRFKKELENVLKSSASDERGLQTKTYCERFCELVVEQTERWQVPLPQLQVLRSALCSFVQGVASFPSDCEHVRYTLSSLALSVFELLLFFGRDEFVEHPLKDILDSFQDCYTSLVRHQNVYLLQVRHVIKAGGPWSSPVLQSILKDSEVPHEEVDRYLSSEVSIFFELRVRYLVACERLPEAIALARRCSQHSVVGRHLYFTQAYLTCLWRASFHECLYKEMANIDGKDAVEILCMMENEEKDEMVLILGKGFLSQQLQNGDMYYLWDLVYIWSRLYLRVNRSKQGFLEECKLMILQATNMKAVFLFIKVILEELGRDGLGFCVELCAQALQTDLKNDPSTKSFLYKTIAYLLPNDLEVCRACALLVFFLERTVESYKTVFLLYTHPDQAYHVDTGPVVNNVRFEVLQILKKGLNFDPEFWSLLNIETHCLKLMSEKVAKAALCEIRQKDKWVQSYCRKGHCHCHIDDLARSISHAKKQNRNDQEVESVKTCDDSASNEKSSKPPGKRRGRKPGTKLVRDTEACPVRRSFRQIDLAKNHTRQFNSRRESLQEQRFLAWEAESLTLKRRGRKPQLPLRELAAQAENSTTQEYKKSEREPKQSDVLKEISLDAQVSEITLKFSYPDNEVDLSSDIPTSLFSTETPHMSESRTDKINASQEILKWLPDTNSITETLLSVETTLCSKKDFRNVEEIVFHEQGSSMVRNFHTYSRETELEEKVEILPKNEEDNPDHNDSKEERLPLSTEQEGEPAEIPECASQIKTVVEIEATQMPTLYLETPTLVEATSGPTEEFILEPKSNSDVLSPQTADSNSPDNAIGPSENVNVDLSSEIITADTIPVQDCIQENITDLHVADPPIPNEKTEIHDHKLTPLSKTEITGSSNVVLKDAEIPVEPQSPKEMLQNTHADAGTVVPELMSPTVGSCQLSLKCGLCNKETKYQYILRHALLHYRIDRKCMFCHKCYTHGRSPSVHFKLHIQELKKSNGQFKENICKRGAELPKTTRQCAKKRLLKRVNCSVQNKCRNIKMRFNSNLNIADLHKDRSDSKVRLRSRLAKNSENSSTLEETEKRICRKRRHLRKLLARRSQSTDENKMLFRVRLARKRAKTMQPLYSEEDNFNTKGNSAHRLNGLNRKRKIKSVQVKNISGEEAQTSLTEDNRDQKIDHVEYAEKSASPVKTESEKVQQTDLHPKNVIKSEMKGNDATMLNSELTKKITSGNHRKYVVAVKKRKMVQVIPEDVPKNHQHKQNTTVTKEINTIGHKYATQAKPKQHSTFFQGKRTGASTEVRCPVEICTFSAKSVLVLSHVLSHHHGDKKALVFFFHFGKEKCLFCSRKVCSPQHFLDHVMCHRGELKHPCYHQGCKERFQTRVELGEHMLGHYPLRATCCFPGCSMQVESVLLLYKHEKTHYRPEAISEQNSFTRITEPKANKSPSQMNGAELKLESVTKSSLSQLGHDTAKHKSPTSENHHEDDEKTPLVLNKGSVNYSSKTPHINGHSNNDKEVTPKSSNTANKEQEPPVTGKPTTKQFIRPPPPAYLDETYISMPKRWKEPQMDSKILGAASSTVINSNKQRCSRCFESFSNEEELQTHKKKCTSLFGFDSDDESST